MSIPVEVGIILHNHIKMASAFQRQKEAAMAPEFAKKHVKNLTSKVDDLLARIAKTPKGEEYVALQEQLSYARKQLTTARMHSGTVGGGERLQQAGSGMPKRTGEGW